MKIELFHTPGCSRCTAAREELESVVRRAFDIAVWRDVNVLDELDYAVELGVLSLPALAIDGKLVFSSLPSAAQLRDALAKSEGAK